MISKSTVILLLMNFSVVLGQEMGVGKSLSMGNLGAALGGLEASMFNASSWAAITGFTAAAFHQNHYFNNDISANGLMLGLPLLNSAFGFHISNYGIDGLYSETKAGLAYARKFGRRLSIGSRVNFHQLQVSRYVDLKTYSVDLGLQYVVSEQWSLGMACNNVAAADYTAQWASELPVQIRLGTAYSMSSEIMVAADYVYLAHERRNDFRLGLEYVINGLVLVRGGAALNPFMHFAGMGLRWDGFRVDFSAAIHPQLGMSPQIFMAYGF